MNKYQEYLFKNFLHSKFIFDVCCRAGNEFNCDKGYYGSLDKDTDSFIITQDEDINIVKYVLAADSYSLPFVDSIYYYYDGKWQKINTADLCRGSEIIWDKKYIIAIDFNSRIEKIKLRFKNNIADDYIIKLKYVEADKEAYYAKQKQNKQDELLKTANIKHSPGDNLVNIYFQPCNDQYDKTEIILYKDGQMLSKYKVDDGVFFKPIIGLAYGTYEYVLKQFDKNGDLLLETDKIKFSISAPNYGGRQTIYWN